MLPGGMKIHPNSIKHVLTEECMWPNKKERKRYNIKIDKRKLPTNYNLFSRSPSPLLMKPKKIEQIKL
jgi:hypothetical protein